MFNTQQDNKDKPKETPPSLFATSLFPGLSNNLFATNNQNPAPKSSTMPTFGAGGLFANLGSKQSKPTMFQGLFPSKQTTADPSKNSAPSLTALPASSLFGGPKLGSLFQPKIPQKASQAKQPSQKTEIKNAPAQNKGLLFSGNQLPKSGGLFNFNNSTGSTTGTGFFGLGLANNFQSKKEQPKDKLQQQNQQIKTLPSQNKSLFSGSLFSNLNKQQTKNTTNNLQKTNNSVPSNSIAQQKTESKNQNGLFTQKPPTSLFGFPVHKQEEAKDQKKTTAETTAKQNTGLFQSLMFNPKSANSQPKQSQPLKLNESNKQPSLFSNQTSFFNASFSKPPTDNALTTPSNPPAPLENNKQNQNRLEESTPILFSANSFSNTTKQQPKLSTQANLKMTPSQPKQSAPSISGAISQPKNQVKQTEVVKPIGTSEYVQFGIKDNKKVQTITSKPNLPDKNDNLLYSFTKSPNATLSTEPNKTSTINSAATQKPSVDSNKMAQSILLTNNRPPLQSQTSPRQPERTFYSVLKPKETPNTHLFDLKTLQHEEKSQNFKSFLNAKNKEIVNSIKLHFTIRTAKYQNHAAPERCSQRQTFYTDLTNLLMRILSLQDKSYQTVAKFIQRIMAQQKYEEVFFKNQQINQQYFIQYRLYQLDYTNKPVLNESNSKELQMMIQKVISKWNIEKTGIINLLLKYPQILKSSLDLYSYLYKHLLQIEIKINENQVPAFRNPIQDYDYLIKHKLIELLTLYNKKFSKSYTNLLPKQSLKAIIKLIEVNKDENVLQLSLKILLNNINLQPQKSILQEVVSPLKETKCLALLPLRTILYKLKYINQQFLPNPEDLYKYIKGDEWIDWLDIYLSESRSQMLQLQTNQPQFLINSLTSISGQLLIKRLLETKKGIYKFFNLLRQQNLQNLYYKLLQACIYNQQSIRQIDQFYFKKVHFNYEYQQVIQYIVNFNDHIGKDQMNEQSTLTVLQPKISLLTKILQIDTEKIVELEKYIFNNEYNKFKKFKPNVEPAEARDGQKLVHLFLDLINIYSFKRWTTQLNISRVFKTITNLLKNKKTESLTLAAIKINKPSFNFLANHLDLQTINSVNELLDQVLSSNYLYDLIIDYDYYKQQCIRLQALYPFRYNDKEYNRLKDQQLQNRKEQNAISIYWIGQLVKIVNRQKFNPYLFTKLLSKLYIVPYELQPETYDTALAQKGVKRYKSNQNKIPPIFEIILTALNNYNIWEEINKTLQFRITRNQGHLILVNKFIQSNNSPEASKLLFFCLKLLRTILKLNEILIQYQDKNPENFIIKTLSSIDVLSRLQLNNIISNATAKHSLLLSILTNIQPEQFTRNDSIRNVTWQAEQADDNSTIYPLIFEYIKRNKGNIDFDLVNNFVKSPNNKYYDNQDSTTTLSLDIVIFLLRLYPEYSVEQTLINNSLIGEEDKLKFKEDMLNKLQTVLINYANADQTLNNKYRIILFLYSLKYDAGQNKLNIALADRIFVEYMRTAKHSPKQPKINQLLSKYLLRDLQQKRDKTEIFINSTIQSIISNFQFRDSWMRNSSIITDPRDIGHLLSQYYHKDFSLVNLNQMQRIIEERAIVQIADQLQSLQNIIKIVLLQLTRRKNTFTLLNCITVLNSLIANNKLLLMQHDMPLQYKTPLNSKQQQLKTRREQPRLFVRDPLELYLTQIRESNKKQQIQIYQKNNILQWFLHIVTSTSTTITNYTKFILTIDKKLYSNNPIDYHIQRQDIKNVELFCYLSFTQNLFSAVEMFGKTQADALSVVELMAESIIDRLSFIRQNESHLFKQNNSIKDGLQILGFCIEWLKSRKDTDESSLLSLIRKINRNYEFLLPEQNGSLSSQSLKIILSCLTTGTSTLSPKFQFQIHQSIYSLLYKYYASIKQLAHNEYSTAISTLVQEAIPVLLAIPPERHQTVVLQILVNIWAEEFNFQYFFNESRLILQLCRIYPEQMVKFKPLTRCSIAQSASTVCNRYEDKQRRNEGMSWLWMLKVATALTDHPQSILIINQIDQFFKKYKQRILSVILNSQDKITKAYVQELQTVLQLLITILRHQLWINFNRTQLEQITYILSHKTIKFLVNVSQTKIRTVVSSNNDKALSQIKSYNHSEDPIDMQDFNNTTHDSIFQFQIRIKLLYCLRNYCILMAKSFKSSFYVEKYFQTIIYDNNRYFSSFWDNFNKNLICLFNFATRQIKYWATLKNLHSTITLLNNCYNAPHTFVQNGYLTTVIQIPQNQTELLSQVHILSYLITELSVVHYLKQKLYISKFNNLIVSHLENFGRRIKEHVKTVQLQSNKHFPLTSQPIKQSHFDSLVRNIQTLSTK